MPTYAHEVKEGRLRLTGYRNINGVAMFTAVTNGAVSARGMSWDECYRFLALYVPNVVEREAYMRKVLPRL